MSWLIYVVLTLAVAAIVTPFAMRGFLAAAAFSSAISSSFFCCPRVEASGSILEPASIYVSASCGQKQQVIT